jgi:hypothetical protein
MEYISLLEMIMLALTLGSITYIFGLLIFEIILYVKHGRLKVMSHVLCSLAELILSISITLIVLRFWFLSIDVMFGFLLLPGIVAEIIAISISYVLVRNIFGR